MHELTLSYNWIFSLQHGGLPYDRRKKRGECKPSAFEKVRAMSSTNKDEFMK